MGTKYFVHHLRNDFIAHLRKAYPCTRQKHLDEDRLSLLIPEKGHNIHAVQTAREHDINIILPAAFYDCCGLSIEEIFHGIVDEDGRRIQLSASDTAVCLYECTFSEDTEDSCKSHLSQAYHDLLTSTESTPLNCRILSQSPPWSSIDYDDLCSNCYTIWKNEDELEHTILWNDLPRVFDLPG